MTRKQIEAVTPVLSILVFMLCCQAAGTDIGRGFDLTDLFKGGFSTYFFAKGIFCAVSLYLAGKTYCVLLDILSLSEGVITEVDEYDSASDADAQFHQKLSDSVRVFGAILVVGGCTILMLNSQEPTRDGTGPTTSYATDEEEYQANLNSLIPELDRFIRRHDRCPNFDEFESMSHMTFSLESDTDYVREMGGAARNDYILGYWVGEWNYCYCSWNGEFYSDYKNEMLGNP